MSSLSLDRASTNLVPMCAAVNVTVATDNRTPFVMPLSADTDIGTLLMVLEADTGIPAAQQRILFNGADIQGNTAATLGSLGVGEAALIYVTRLQHQQPQQPQQREPQQQAAPAAEPLSPRNYIGMTFDDIPPNCDPRVLREIIRVNPPMMQQLKHGNPALAEAAEHADPQRFVDVLRQQTQDTARRKQRQQAELNALYRRVEANPFDVEAQKKVEEIIRAKNVESNHNLARAHMPEAFTRVCMLYIHAEVNGVPLKAFVDSGAQNTIMTQACAERAGIMRLIDTRFAGQAVGVGTCKILGRVHMAQLKIGDQNFNCSFTVLENAGGGGRNGGKGVEFLFGLDMLKRHQANINLKNNRLEIEGQAGTISVPFLSEAEIPDDAFNPSAKADATSGGGGGAASSRSRSSSSSSSNNSSTTSSSGGGGGGGGGASLPAVPAASTVSDAEKQAEELAKELLETMNGGGGSSGNRDSSSGAAAGGAGGRSGSTGGGAVADGADLKRHKPEPLAGSSDNATAAQRTRAAPAPAAAARGGGGGGGSRGGGAAAGSTGAAALPRTPGSPDLDDLAASLMADLAGASAAAPGAAPGAAPAAAPVAAPTAAPAAAPVAAPAAAPAAAQAEGPQGGVSAEAVAELTAMGFSEEQAVQALFACGGDVAAATNFLVQFS